MSKQFTSKESMPSELQERLALYFSALQGAVDISPAERYRLEGYLEACLELTPLSSEMLEKFIFAELAQLQIERPTVIATPSDSWRLPWQRPPVSALE